MPTVNELPTIEPLPDPFEWSDGRGRLENLSDWRYRRNDIKAEIEHYEIGLKPDRPDTINASYSEGTLTVNITVNGNTLTLISAVTLPEGDGPFPAVIGMGGGTGSLPYNIFTSRDIAQVPFNFGQVMAWQQTRGSEPINALYPDLIYMGAYSAWSWGVSRLIDGLELVSEDLPIDLQHLAVTGCSFAGKMALFAGAFDERIALTIPQESGGGGLANWRFSEILGDVETLSATSHVWFIQDLFEFSDHVPKLPYDHHELMAMVAPRALFALGNPSQVWLAEESGYVTCKATQEVYNALGVPDRFGYSFNADHGHCVLPEIQLPEVEAFVEKFLLGNESANTNITTHSFTTNLAPWITWTTPTLANGTSFLERASLVYPSNDQTQMDTAITFLWNRVNDAEKYYFQLTRDPTFKNITYSDSTADTTKTISALLEGKMYYWRVQVKNSTGSFGPWSDQWNFTTFIPSPPMPEIISPSPHPDQKGWYIFKWNKAQYTDQYRIQVSRLETFTPLAVPTITTSDTVVTVSGLLEAQKYHWRVQGENIGGSGPWSALNFTTILLAPSNLDLHISASNEITLTWTDNSKREEGYVIERKQSPDSSFTVIDTLEGSGSEYVNTSIEQSGTYTYRIKAYKDSVESIYSNEASLSIVGIQEDELIPTEYSIGQNYPNPFNPTTKIKFALPKTALTKIIIYDLLGREIRTLINKKLEAGYHEINFDAYNLPAGIYFYRVQSGNFIHAKKMILMK
jgi:hypothetical protein